MTRLASIGFVMLAVGIGLPGPAAAAAPDPATSTPNAFLLAADGAPTFVVGTLGDARSDRAVRAQVAFVATLFPRARVVDDTAVTARLDAGGDWPAHAVLYGGPHVNAVTARISGSLPLQLGAGRLALAERSFSGPGYQLIALVPAAADHPELLLYAGTGTPGVSEINSVRHGAEPILVADAFGRLVTARWDRDRVGAVVPVLDPPARRIAWRTVVRALKGSGGTAALRVHFPAQLPEAADDAEVVAACVRGLAGAVTKLAIAAPGDVDVYVYPDRGSKRSLTGDAGDGHARVGLGALHVLRCPPTVAGRAALEGLLAHEGTHALAHQAWGAAGTALMGEGLAVWASGRYAGRTLASWASSPPEWPALDAILGAGFRAHPEGVTYPMSGLVVAAAIDRVGLEKVRDLLYGAPPDGWQAACERAGTSASALEAALPR